MLKAPVLDELFLERVELIVVQSLATILVRRDDLEPRKLELYLIERDLGAFAHFVAACGLK